MTVRRWNVLAVFLGAALALSALFFLLRSRGPAKPALLGDLSDQAAGLVVVMAAANCKANDMNLSWKPKDLPSDPEAVDKAMAFLRDQMRRHGSLSAMCDRFYLENVIGKPFS